MLTPRNPDAVHEPASRYSHAMEVTGRQRWLHISGQIGIRPDGSVCEGAEAQLEQAWHNIFAILADAGMAKDDLVKVTVFLTDRNDIQAYREVRDRMLGGPVPASTLLVVAGLASPNLLIEIEAVAAA